MSPAGQRWVVTRRRFLTSAATLTAGLVARETTPRAADGGAPQVREPAVGQSWRYAKRDYFTGSMLDTQVDRVSAVGQIIEVESSSGSGDDKTTPDAAWGAAWLRKNISGGRIRGRLPSEIQASWGMVLVDPHWSEIQMYEKPLPLWPAQLRPGWSITVNTQYMTPESPDELPWQLTMHAHRWESIIVPAGRFLALRYNNLINFRFTNISERVAAQRLETIWFAPEIGRWVARESFGSFREAVGTDVQESSYRWELLSWT